MNKQLQDKAWAVLPKEFREEVRRQYHIAIDSKQHYTLCTLEYLFGGHLHDLTSDTETEEMLIISRKAAEEFYNKYLGDALQAVNRITLRKDINTLFGGKCRVGEDDIAVNKTEPKQGSESAQNENKQPAVSDNQLRIMVAAEIAAGICCNPNTVEMAKYNRKEEGEEHVVIAQYAIKIADALIKEINGKGD